MSGSAPRDGAAFELGVPFPVVGEAFTQILFFLTPIVYPSSRIPEAYRWITGLNPMAGVVEGFRWALLGNVPPPGPMLAVSVVMTCALLVGGLFYFRRMERSFADVV